MKKLILFLTLISITSLTHSQENKIESTGNIGIGITTPTANLEIYNWGNLAHGRIHTNQHAGMAKLEIAGGTAGFGAEYSGWNIYHSHNQTSKDLYFRHGQTGDPSIVFTDNGNLGIGIKNPSANLEIYSWGNLAHGRIHTNQHAGMAKLEIAGGAAGFGAEYSGWNIYHSHNQTSKDLYFRHGQTGDPSIVFTDNGNLGIGIKNPSANLEIYSWGNLAHGRIHTNQHAGMAKLEIAGGAAGFGAEYSGWNIYHSHNQTSKDLYFRHGQTGEPNVVFADNGNVAIYGKLESKEVKVTLTPTADFVFEDSYNLPSLEYIENHIKEKRHLPEIASAKEMEENGINIGEFQIQLLQKIEELTLYTIQQEKKIQKFEKENEEVKLLNKKLLELQLRLERLESEK